MKLDEIRWGMIGCGDVTEVKSGPAFSRIPHSKLQAVMCRTPGRAADYAERHGVPKSYTDGTELIADPEINAIYIATPPDSHLHYTEIAARAGKPVYVEKPMARNYTECLKMIDICKKNHIPLFVAYYRRCLPKFQTVRKLLHQGKIGETRTVSITLHLPPRDEDFNPDNPPWRVRPHIAGGGYFVDLASHQLDLLDYLISPILTEEGIAVNQSGLYPAEDMVVAVFRFENEIPACGSWCFTVSAEHQLDRIEITGSEGRLEFSAFDASPVRFTGKKGEEEFSDFWPDHVHQPLVETVVQELRGEGKCPSSGESAARTSRVMDQILGK